MGQGSPQDLQAGSEAQRPLRLSLRRPSPVLLLLLLLAAGASAVWTAAFARRLLEPSDSADDTALFWSEGAFYYRYARMAARGEAPPRLDKKAHWPGGLDTLRQTTALPMAWAHGLSYRLVSRVWAVPLPVYLGAFISACAGALVLLLYAAVRRSGGGPWAALAAAALFAASRAGVARSLTGYGLETFAMPLLASGFVLLLGGLSAEPSPEPRRRARRRLAASAAVFTLSLGTWHFSRFFLAGLHLALTGAALWAGSRDREGVERVRLFQASCLALALLGALFIPVLKGAGFLISLPVVCAAFGLGLLTARTRAGWTLRTTLRVAGAALLAALLLFSRREFLHGSDFRHVYSMVVDRLYFLNDKPADPDLLRPETRLYWMPPYVTPSLGFSVYYLSSLWLFGGLGLALALRRGRPTVSSAFLIVFTFLMLAGYGLTQRLITWLAFLLSCWAGLAAGDRSLSPRARAWTLSALLAAAVLEAGLSWRWLHGLPDPLSSVSARLAHAPEQTIPEELDLRRLLGWIKAETPPGAVVLTDYTLSPSILTSTDRPILFHSVFEVSSYLDEVMGMLQALYNDEETFYRYCRERGADYFVYRTGYALDSGRSSWRYSAGRTRLERSAAAYRMHFAPEGLSHFRLVYQDAGARVFRVGEPGGPDSLPYEPIYDPKRFGEDAPGDVLNDARVAPSWLGFHTAADARP